MQTEKENNTLLKYLDTATSIFLMINTKHIVEKVNKKGCEILGYKAKEILGKNWFQNFIPKDEREELSSFFERVMRNEEEPPDSNENQILLKNGKTRLIRWRNSVLKDHTGSITGLIGSGEDITEQARAREKLFLRNRALDAAGNGIIIVDALAKDLPIIYSNQAFSKMTGYKKSEVLGKNCRFLQNDDRDQEAIMTIAAAIKNGKDCRVILRNYRKDGSLFWNELTITPLYNEYGKLTHFIGVQNDVTEIHHTKKQLEDYAISLEEKVVERTREIEATVQKLVETNLNLEDQVQETKIAENKSQRSQAQFLAIVKNFPKGLIVVFNADHELVYVEGEELKRIDLKKSHFEGKRIDDIPIFSKQQITKIKDDIENTLKGRNLSFEMDFGENNYEVNSTPLCFDENKNTWALFVYHNITDQKQVQQGLNNALRAEQDLNELKSRFISMASHEFRTPLSAILSSAILIEKQNEPGKEENRLKHVRRIRSNVKNLVVILNDFLSLSKLEEGKVKAKPQNFDLIQFSKLLVDEIKLSRKKGQEIILVHPKTEIYVYLDPKLLSHILINLLSNALKYSEEHQNIHMKIIHKGETVVFEISDNGIGIPIEEHKNLFERFFRAENVTNIQGTGLGLHIVKQYTELMQGSVGFQSKSNKGSIFTVQLPQKLNENEKNISN
jgi:PAS domain S-box-containing protein